MSSPREPKQPAYMYVLMRDVAATAIVGILLLGIHELGQPFIRGFHCDDETIRYPHHGSTVSSNVCYFVGSMLNILLIMLFEFLNLKNESRSSRNDSTNGFDSKEYIRNVYCRLAVWFFGAISSELLTDIAKVTAGRLRPHFIDVCRPIVRSNGETIPLDQYCFDEKHRYQYIMDYYCSGTSSNMRDIRLSFLSGHSSYSFYSASHAVFYLQSRMDVTKFGLFKPALQVLITAAAFYTALTRVSDYKHHWQDVVAGTLLGVLVAASATKCLFPAFSKTHARFSKNGVSAGGIRVVDDHVGGGEELNRVSY